MLVLILIFVVETVVVPVPSCSNCIFLTPEPAIAIEIEIILMVIDGDGTGSPGAGGGVRRRLPGEELHVEGGSCVKLWIEDPLDTTYNVAGTVSQKMLWKVQCEIARGWVLCRYS